MSIMRVCVFLS